MKGHTAFMNWKTEHNKDIGSTQIDLSTHLMQFLSKFYQGLGRHRKVYSEIHIEKTRTRISQRILKKIKVGRLTLPDIMPSLYSYSNHDCNIG